MFVRTAKVNTQLFPAESKVGYPGPTVTGAEPAAIQTAQTYPYNDGNANAFPLVNPQPQGSDAESPKFDISKYWGNLSPWYSVHSSDYGLPDASPLAPEGCDVTQVHLLYRHGARYPTSGAAPGTFAQKIVNATKTGLTVSGELAFLGDWTYKLGAELLTPFGRSQNFMLGVTYRQLYGHLLNNFTEAGTIPVFRTESQDRMVKTAENFALACSDRLCWVSPIHSPPLLANRAVADFSLTCGLLTCIDKLSHIFKHHHCCTTLNSIIDIPHRSFDTASAIES